MATTENPLDLFAKVVNGVITEFPVYRSYIGNRGEPTDWYIRVEDLPKPTDVPRFHYLAQNVYFKDGRVFREFVVTPTSLKDLLASLVVKSSDGVAKAADIHSLDAETIQRVYNLVSDYVTQKFSDWAKTRGYGIGATDSFVSLSTYAFSANTKLQGEAKQALALRDTAWANLLAYFGDVSTGTKPVPMTLAEIDALIPPMKWPDELTPAA